MEKDKLISAAIKKSNMFGTDLVRLNFVSWQSTHATCP